MAEFSYAGKNTNKELRDANLTKIFGGNPWSI